VPPQCGARRTEHSRHLSASLRVRNRFRASAIGDRTGRVLEDVPHGRHDILISRPMELFPVDDDGRLFISPAIDNSDVLERFGIDTVIDLEGGLDNCIPTATNACRT